MSKVLFLGAGASKDVGIPLANELINKIDIRSDDILSYKHVCDVNSPSPGSGPDESSILIQPTYLKQLSHPILLVGGPHIDNKLKDRWRNFLGDVDDDRLKFHWCTAKDYFTGGCRNMD
jgi:hypothetical protein